MRKRLDLQDDVFEVRALYSVPALARMAHVSPDMLRRVLRSNGVTFLHAGRVLLVPLSEILKKIPPLWKTLESRELLRRGPCPHCGKRPTDPVDPPVQYPPVRASRARTTKG
jgi:hypothetical protein